MKKIIPKIDYKKADRWLLALLLIFAFSLPLLTPRIYSSDEIQYYVYLRSLYKDGDIDFSNEYRVFADRAPEEYEKSGFVGTFLQQETVTGHKINFAPVGCATLWLPWFFAADAYVHLARFLGSDIAADGFSSPYIQLVTYGSMVYGFLGILLIFSFLRRLFGEMESFISSLLVWFGTPVVYYMYVQSPMSHNCSLFVVSLFIWFWHKTLGSLTVKRFVILGLLLGLAGLVREQNLFFIVLLLAEGLEHLRRYYKEKVLLFLRKFFAVYFLAGVVAFTVYIPQLISYKVLYDRFGPSDLVQRKMFWTSPYGWKVLFSYHHGLFFWTPLLFFAILGLLLFGVKERFLGVSLLSAFLIQVYVSGAVRSWHVSGAFGHRRFINCSLVFAIGLAYLIGRILKRRKKVFAIALAGLFIIWNLQLVVQFAVRIMDRRMINIDKVAVNAVTELPKKVYEIGAKFLFNRDRLYKIGGSGKDGLGDAQNERKNNVQQ